MDQEFNSLSPQVGRAFGNFDQLPNAQSSRSHACICLSLAYILNPTAQHNPGVDPNHGARTCGYRTQFRDSKRPHLLGKG